MSEKAKTKTKPEKTPAPIESSKENETNTNIETEIETNSITTSHEVLNLDQLVRFKKHPFKLYDKERMDEFVEDIKARGVQSPIHVRPLADGKYEILEGHNRVEASKKAELDSIPAIIFEGLNDDEAQIKVVRSNFNQRSTKDMKPSELAKSLDMLNEAIKKKPGYRSDLKEENDGSQSDNRSKTMNEIGKLHNMSQATVSRYIRAAKLSEPLLKRLDDKNIGLGIAEHLSYLNKTEQGVVEGLLRENLKIDVSKAKTLHNKSKKNKASRLTEEVIRGILEPEASDVGKGKSIKPFKLESDYLSRFFEDNQSQEDIKATITKALELYHSTPPKQG